MKNSEKLKKAKALIANPANWTQRAYARDAEGEPVGSTDPRATCFCSLGALNHMGLGGYEVGFVLQNTLEDAMRMDVADFNDSSSHEEVMGAWDRAIESALAKEGGIK